jgi:hypothetical protein
MKAKVHYLTQNHLGTGKPQQDVVEGLKDLLRRAKTGEIIGLNVAYVLGNNATCTNVFPGCASDDRMFISVLALEHRMRRNYFESETEVSYPPDHAS